MEEHACCDPQIDLVDHANPRAARGREPACLGVFPPLVEFGTFSHDHDPSLSRQVLRRQGGGVEKFRWSAQVKKEVTAIEETCLGPTRWDRPWLLESKMCT